MKVYFALRKSINNREKDSDCFMLCYGVIMYSVLVTADAGLFTGILETYFHCQSTQSNFTV